MKHLLCTLLAIIVLYVQNGSSTETDADESNGEPLSRFRRGGLSMLRLGRGLHMLRLGKRSLSMLRLGRRSSPETPAPSDLDILLYELISKLKYGKNLDERQVPVPRYGRQSDADDEELGGGMSYDLDYNRQARGPPPRLGRFRRSADNNKEVEMDKERAVVPEPRRVQMEDIPAGNWNSEYGSDFNDYEAEKRTMNMLRLGKRRLNMLRLGKRDFADQEMDKRMLNMLRLGKREAPNVNIAGNDKALSPEK